MKSPLSLCSRANYDRLLIPTIDKRSRRVQWKPNGLRNKLASDSLPHLGGALLMWKRSVGGRSLLKIRSMLGHKNTLPPSQLTN